MNFSNHDSDILFASQFDQYMLIHQIYYLTVMVLFVFVNFIIFFVDVSGRILNWSFYGIVAEKVGQLYKRWNSLCLIKSFLFTASNFKAKWKHMLIILHVLL